LSSKLHASEPEGVSFNAAKRIKQLNAIKKWLEGNGDEFNYLPTVKAITKAYKKKELDWNLGLVTYWIDGKPICQPRVHDMQVVAIITQDPKFKEGFWVEGVSFHPDIQINSFRILIVALEPLGWTLATWPGQP
jgi:hypothetical protein